MYNSLRWRFYFNAMVISSICFGGLLYFIFTFVPNFSWLIFPLIPIYLIAYNILRQVILHFETNRVGYQEIIIPNAKAETVSRALSIPFD